MKFILRNINNVLMLSGLTAVSIGAFLFGSTIGFLVMGSLLIAVAIYNDMTERRR